MLKPYVCEILFCLPSGEMRERVIALKAVSPEAAMDQARGRSLALGDPADFACAGRVTSVRSEPELRVIEGGRKA